MFGNLRAAALAAAVWAMAAVLYKRRNLIERMFGRLKDRRRIATRYDRCAHAFFSAIHIAATVIFWFMSLSLAYGTEIKLTIRTMNSLSRRTIIP